MRNVIVTGASRGLGLGIATALSGAGYQVIAIARSSTPGLEEAIGSASRSGKGALHFRAFDLLDTRRLPELVSGLRKQFGAPYALVNNAGLGTSGMLAMMREDQVDSLVRLNIVSPILLTKAVVRAMMSEKAGRIVNMSSIVASTGYHGLSVYSATKAALLGFTRSLAREVGPLGITVNAVAPGFVDTEMTAEMESGQREQVKRRSALRRMAEVTDVAAAVEYLLSDGARNVTGTTLTVDAGNTA
ncbi:MAG: SDR family oxidoreductase [Proteobacteria bacterium]|nr:SDR family oxidoreductase [Pseudomonadota bacterium]